MNTTSHISNWSLKSYSAIERTACGLAYNIDFQQPYTYKPGIS